MGLMLPEFLGNRHMKVVSPIHQLPLTPRRQLWHSFLLEAKLTPGPYCDWKDYVNEKSQQFHQELNPQPPACNAVSQPTSVTTHTISALLPIVI